MLSDYKVLVLDDHAFQCTHMKAMLEEVGFSHVEMTQSAEEALARVQASAYHLILMDISMPGMDGVQFIHELTRRELSPMLAIATACSRRMMNSVSLMAKEKGLAVIGAMTKPVSREHAQALADSLIRCRAAGTAPAAPAFEASDLLDRNSVESALRNGRIQAWFQPKKSLSSGNIVGAEALARWQHHELGLMLPASFLKAVREYGLDRALLVRMLEDGMHAYCAWRRQGYRIPVSINLPTSLLDAPQLPDELFNMVMSSGVPPGEITFELLEDETTSVAGQYYMGASRLRLKGFGLAQDDFGRGYSSMYSLISTPFTELKIDRAFVCGAADDEIRAAALVSSVQLGRQLGLQVTAEGVETIRDLEFLRRIGCDCAQGYLISAAADAGAFSRLLADEPGSHVLHPVLL